MRKNKKCDVELVARVKAMAKADARVSLQDIADCLGIDSSSLSRIPYEKLGYRNVSAEWIPNVPTSENKRQVTIFKGSA